MVPDHTLGTQLIRSAEPSSVVGEMKALAIEDCYAGTAVFEHCNPPGQTTWPGLHRRLHHTRACLNFGKRRFRLLVEVQGVLVSRDSRRADAMDGVRPVASRVDEGAGCTNRSSDLWSRELH